MNISRACLLCVNAPPIRVARLAGWPCQLPSVPVLAIADDPEPTDACTEKLLNFICMQMSQPCTLQAKCDLSRTVLTDLYTQTDNCLRCYILTP
jgi:hypothetical protein